ncbi:MAG TPA: hypothetical protein VK196_22390 [Magnetospirillum sp.]|nr:hypothetical protein [Magnetospirillum sp.]
MRKALRPNPGRNAVARPEVVKAPTKGWSANALPIEAEEGTAVILENWFPEATAIRPRKGYTSQATGVGAGVNTLMGYVSGSTRKLFAAGNASIFDVSSVGAVGAAVQSGLTSTKFSYVNFATAGGQYLYMVNGADAARYYDGSSWTQPVITGASSSTFSYVTAHKARLWFIKANTTTAYYLPVDSIAGAATAFELGSQLLKGGHLVAMASWSVDSGQGMDDLLAFWSSEGEILVYAGSNPSSDYAIVGRYTSGKPIGNRPLYPIGGDLAMISEDGVLAMSAVMRFDRLTAKEKSLSSRIIDEYLDAAADYRDNFGWQIITLPKASMALINVPGAGDAGASIQFAYNVSTKAWSKFSGIDALCWELYDGDIFFGTDAGSVFKAESGGSDDGAAITARCLPAFSHLGAPGRTKHVKQIQPLFSTDLTDYTFGAACIVNFAIPESVGGSAPAAQGIFTWDVSLWDGSDVWGGNAVWDLWDSSNNIGYVVSPYSIATIDADNNPEFDFSLIGWTILYEAGGIAFSS